MSPKLGARHHLKPNTTISRHFLKRHRIEHYRFITGFDIMDANIFKPNWKMKHGKVKSVRSRLRLIKIFDRTSIIDDMEILNNVNYENNETA